MQVASYPLTRIGSGAEKCFGCRLLLINCEQLLYINICLPGTNLLYSNTAHTKPFENTLEWLGFWDSESAEGCIWEHLQVQVQVQLVSAVTRSHMNDRHIANFRKRNFNQVQLKHLYHGCRSHLPTQHFGATICASQEPQKTIKESPPNRRHSKPK